MKKFIRLTLIIVNIVVAVCMLLAYMSCFISPETIWWLSFFGLGYVYLLVANLFFVFFWLFTSTKKKAFFSLVIVLIGWNMIWRNFQVFPKTAPETDKSVKVLTYNVHMFSQMDTEQSDGKQLNIFDYISKSGANIVCMQEFMSSKTGVLKPEIIHTRLNNTPHSYIEATIGPIGLAIFSTYPIIQRKLVFSDNTTNACIFSDLVIDTDTVRVYNMHLKSIGFNKEERDLLNNALKKEYHDSDMNTVKSIIRQMTNASFRRAQQVDYVSKHIAKSPYPVIICGDFNDPPTSYSYQNVRGDRKDSFIEAGRGYATTYNIGRLSSQRIDYILYSPFFKAYEYESPRVHLSDHFPVVSRLVKQK